LFELAHRVRGADGKIGWTLSRAVPLLDEAGEVVEWFGTASDVTFRHEAEVRLRESEARFRAMADDAPVRTWITDESGACIYLNRRWYEFTGQTETEGLGHGWLEAVRPDDRHRSEQAFLAANAGRKTFRLEYRLRSKDGPYRWGLDAASPRIGANGAFLGYFGSVIDIDERREAEAGLQTLADVVPAFVWFASPDGRLRALGDLLDTVTGTRIRVVLEVADTPCHVRADLSPFETAHVNMAVNARDAMDGQGTLTVRLDCGGTLPPIRRHAGSARPFAAVSLSDTGSGIAPEVLPRIFEPFFTIEEVGKGTGLGLSQVFGFAKQSGGDVDVSSTPGRGATFTLYLPEVAAEAAGEAGPVAIAFTSPTGTGQRVLVVEDNVDVGTFATQILEDLGYRTTWAANAEEALDRIGPDGADFDVVFSDVVMPGMGGVELAR
jgi:PAS domain S-box-containing protein